MPSWVLWSGLGLIYLVLLVTLAVTTYRKGHYVLFGAGFLLPFLWIVGAVIEPRR